ncbi:MAG TPA: hypothetical protein VE754_01415 [Actinomycetota bacterium]|nr:hypothetical protein [Actinomycetota bacterium]
MANFLVGTSGGLYRDDGSLLDERPVTHLAAGPGGVWGVLEQHVVARWQDGWKDVASLSEHRARCVLPDGEGALVGTSEARLFRVDEHTIVPVASFDEVAGRDDWYTPWGGPPDTRSLARSDTALIAGVHVGGVVRSTDGQHWEPTAMDIDADVHQVAARGTRLLAATAFGLAVSDDGGDTWAFHTDGLHATYCRAVSDAGRIVLVSASRGHTGTDAALYRWPGSGPLVRCADGLPMWFGDNVDSHCLAAAGHDIALGTHDGRVFRSDDAGETWYTGPSDLPAIAAVVAS